MSDVLAKLFKELEEWEAKWTNASPHERVRMKAELEADSKRHRLMCDYWRIKLRIRKGLAVKIPTTAKARVRTIASCCMVNANNDLSTARSLMQQNALPYEYGAIEEAMQVILLHSER